MGRAERSAAEFLRDRLQMDGMKSSLLSEIFSEEPPTLNVFLQDHKYLNYMRPTLPVVDEQSYAFNLSPIQYDFVRNFEQIFKPDLYIAMVEEFGTYWSPLPIRHLFGLEWGKGAGKDTSVRVGFVRIVSLLSHLRNPQSYFSMASFDEIQLLNVAVNAQQAREAFFDPMKRLFLTNKYLSGLFRGDDPAEGANRIKLEKNITIISGNSLAENQEGLNLIAGVADEISAFKTAEEFRDKGDGRVARGADQIVNMIRSSSSSRFPESYKVVQISWPRFSGDAIEKAIATGLDSQRKLGIDKSPWYVSGPYPTWEVKPGVTREDFQEHFDDDPEMAEMMYGCNPPKASNAFIRDEFSIDEAFSTIKPEPVTVEYYWGTPPASAKLVNDAAHPLQEGWQVKFHYSDDLVAVPGALYALHGDLAIKGDRAGIAMSHVRDYRECEGGEDRPIIKNDFVFSFDSDLGVKPPREVQIRWYRQLIWELMDKGFIIGIVTFDQFQSFDMMQMLEVYGIESGLLSLDRKDKVYQVLKDVILDARLEGYRPIEHVDPRVVKEIKRLRKVGNKVDHLPSFSKDESDALAGSVFDAIQVGGFEDSGSLFEAMYGDAPIGLDMFLYSGPSAASNDFGLFGQGSATDIFNTGYFHR